MVSSINYPDGGFTYYRPDIEVEKDKPLLGPRP